jgi:wyosine [tRNA(Phe)-imidazoG37] synthetase (radical SAM superfamily)
LAQGVKADFVTISGSGEPTLNSHLGELIAGIKKVTEIPVAILTNGTLLYREDVRADCCLADVVVPSLDAGDESTFQKINRPHKDISVEKLINGLCAFREEFSGQIWLEVFFVKGFNTDIEQISKIKQAIKRIRPDKIHLNTAVRPTAEPGVKKLAIDKLHQIAALLGDKVEVAAESSLTQHLRDIEEAQTTIGIDPETVLSVLKRRPCSLDEICAALEVNRNQARKCLEKLELQGAIRPEQRYGTVFFRMN